MEKSTKVLKSYSAPYAEKINFNYSNQVVASGSGNSSGCYWEISVSHSLFGCRDKQNGEGAMNA